MVRATCRYSLACRPLVYSKCPSRSPPVRRSNSTTSSCVGTRCIGFASSLTETPAGNLVGERSMDRPCRIELADMLTSTSQVQRAVPTGLGREDLIRAFRLMYLSRRIDDREILLKRQNKIFFQVSGAGHEAIQTAAGLALRPGHDWFFLYYRDRALALSLGVTPEEIFLGAVGAESDPSSAGRQMPSHWSIPRLHIVSPSSATGTQLLPAVGCAHGNRILDPASDAITLACIGEGATSEGEFWEAINAACLESL